MVPLGPSSTRGLQISRAFGKGLVLLSRTALPGRRVIPSNTSYFFIGLFDFENATHSRIRLTLEKSAPEDRDLIFSSSLLYLVRYVSKLHCVHSLFGSAHTLVRSVGRESILSSNSCTFSASSNVAMTSRTHRNMAMESGRFSLLHH